MARAIHTPAALIDQTLNSWIGKAKADLDRNDPVNMIIIEMATDYAKNVEIIRERAESIAKDMAAVVAGQSASALADCSDGRRYDAAVAALEAIRRLSSTAISAWVIANPDAV